MLDATETLDLYRHADVLARKLAAELDIGPLTVDEVVMLHLIDQGVNRPSALATAVAKEPPTVSHVLRRFREANLIKSTQYEGDARGRVITLTRAGHNALVRALTDMPALRFGGPQLLRQIQRAAETQ